MAVEVYPLKSQSIVIFPSSFFTFFFSFLVTIIDVGSLTFNGKMSVINKRNTFGFAACS